MAAGGYRGCGGIGRPPKGGGCATRLVRHHPPPSTTLHPAETTPVRRDERRSPALVGRAPNCSVAVELEVELQLIPARIAPQGAAQLERR